MFKKSLIILFIIFAFLCVSNICFAANTSNTTNNVKNAVSSTTDTVIDGVSNLAHDVRNGVGHVENGIEDALTMDDNMTDTDRRTATGTTGDYQATRTADMTRAATGTNNTIMWVWLILAVASIVIISLVWYYGSQNRID